MCFCFFKPDFVLLLQLIRDKYWGKMQYSAHQHDYFHFLSQALKTFLSAPPPPKPPQTEPGISTSDILSWIKQEEETQVGAPQEPKESDMCKGTYAGEYRATQAQGMSDH